MISEKSKELAEACYIAKDIADFFRSFAEWKELNTTPISIIPEGVKTSGNTNQERSDNTDTNSKNRRIL